MKKYESLDFQMKETNWEQEFFSKVPTTTIFKYCFLMLQYYKDILYDGIFRLT